MNSNRALRAASVMAGLGIALATAPASAQAEPVTPIPRLEVERYLGDWRQLAAIPQPFNLVCARDTRANYSLTPNGDIAVRNSCTTWWGGGNEIAGVARVTDPATQAQLAVSFRDESDPRTNYVVTAIDPDYSWALVVNPERTAGFVLARAAALSAGQWTDVRAAIAAAGVDSCLFLTSPTTGGAAEIAPLCTR
ncbi:lipocalin family protein [Nocardia goodfellowii]|uniref:Apolipoprotein D and lipocalin family protein n=1 Tax=Nocardia goodfellowii TaxID=882446 RepID=A0ABS4QNS1_9NOCA|nr:lipocalin family protein [Nocardia goodfellowii]MBP2193352.1 apolipoprotein D and lipocalin family protein [Nocardia goodfellowii]